MIESLPEVIEGVAGKIPVLLDGGIRRGTDIFKAPSLGATAVKPTLKNSLRSIGMDICILRGPIGDPTRGRSGRAAAARPCPKRSRSGWFRLPKRHSWPSRQHDQPFALAREW